MTTYNTDSFFLSKFRNWSSKELKSKILGSFSMFFSLKVPHFFSLKVPYGICLEPFIIGTLKGTGKLFV